MNPQGAAIITAAGSSSRMGGVKKEYCLLPVPTEVDKKPLTVLGAVAGAFAASPRISLIVFSVPKAGENEARSALPPDLMSNGTEKELLFVQGGPTRRASVHHALSALEKYQPPWVLIHDGARPWITASLIERIIDAVCEHGAAIPLLPLLETPKEGDFSGGTGFISRHLKRAGVGIAQTPQGFAFPDILRAHEKAAQREERDKVEYTDDAEIWGEFIGPVAAIPGEKENRKITFLSDLEL